MKLTIWLKWLIKYFFNSLIQFLYTNNKVSIIETHYLIKMTY